MIISSCYDLLSVIFFSWFPIFLNHPHSLQDIFGRCICLSVEMPTSLGCFDVTIFNKLSVFPLYPSIIDRIADLATCAVYVSGRTPPYVIFSNVLSIAIVLINTIVNLNTI